MADVIVYPWHGLPQRYTDNSGIYTPDVSTTFDADGPQITNKYSLQERYTANGDGTYSPYVALASSGSDVLCYEHGMDVRYVPNGDGTYAQLVATASLGHADRSVFNEYGLVQIYINLGDDTFAPLVDSGSPNSTVFDDYGFPVGFSTVAGGYAPTVSVGGAVSELLVYGGAAVTYGGVAAQY